MNKCEAILVLLSDDDDDDKVDRGQCTFRCLREEGHEGMHQQTAYVGPTGRKLITQWEGDDRTEEKVPS